MFRINLIKNTITIVYLLLSYSLTDAKNISGKVVDQNGQAVPFASILTDLGKGTVADAKGIFRLELDESLTKIRVSAVGFESIWLEITGETEELHVQLKESATNLSEVVVTGNFSPESARHSVYQVRSVDKATIVKRGAGNIQEVLNTELGIRFSQDNALGASNLEMLGMSGQNVKILIDGVPMVGRQGVSNEININQIDINTIEKIEIIEGPMSVIYGADALAGVINIITKNPNQTKGYSIQARLQEETAGQEYSPFFGQGNHIRSLQGTYSTGGKWRFGAGFTQNRFGGWKGEMTDRQFEWLPRDQNLGNASVGFIYKDFELDYALDLMHESITNFGPDNRLEVIDREFVTTRWMHRLNGRWDISPVFKISTQAAFTDFSRETIATVTNVRTGEQRLSAAPGAQARIDYQGLTLRLIGSWTLSNQLSLQPGIDINTEQGSGERISENEGIGDYAVFLTGEWSPAKWAKIRPGIRSAYNTAYQTPAAIPSINSKFLLAPNLDLRLSYAMGFRAPSVRELYFDFFDASHSIIGNPDLRAETSNSFNGSLNFTKTEAEKRLNTSLSGFYNEVTDMIAYGIDPMDPRITTLFNIENFRTMGFIFNQSVSFKGLAADLGFSRIGRFNRLSVEEMGIPEMLFSTEVSSNISYMIPWINTTVNVFYKWTGPLPGFELTANGENAVSPREIKLEGFHWMDLTFNKTIGKSLTLNTGVRNLGNVVNILSTGSGGGAHGGGPQRPMGFGRSYFLGLTYQLKSN